MISLPQITDYILSKKDSILWYQGALLIGSQATGYANELSDIDIHVFTTHEDSDHHVIWDILEGHVVSIHINVIKNTLYIIQQKANAWYHYYRRVYGVQSIVLDDPYTVISSMKQLALNTPIVFPYRRDEFIIVFSTLHEFERAFSNFNPFMRQKLLFYVFEQYSFYNGYDHVHEINIWFWKAAQKIFYDDDYAKNHWGKIYPDKVFLWLRQKAFYDYSDENVRELLLYVIAKMKELGDFLFV